MLQTWTARAQNLSPRTVALYAGIAGLVTAAGHAPFSCVLATVSGLILGLVLVVSAQTLRRAAWTAWAFGFGYFALALHWIVEPFLVDITRHGWMAPFAIILMAGGMAIFWGLAGFFSAKLTPNGKFRAVGFAVALALVEILRSYVFTGFPWGLLGYTTIDTWAAWSAQVLGPHFVTALLLISVALAVEFGLVLGGTRAVGGMGIMVSVPFAFGLLISPQELSAPTDVTVRVIQPNAPQHQKWDPEFADVFYERQIEFTRAGDPVDIVVWPETAIPYLLDHSDDILAEVSAAARGAQVVVGMQRSDGARYYNSLITVEDFGQVTQVYDKSHLVPFGEYIPLGNLARRLGLRGLSDVDGAGFAAGDKNELIQLKGLGDVVPLICYEGIFPHEINAHTTPIAAMLLITNDAWFGKYAGPQQHLVQARFRSIEQGVAMIRSANTGISAVIDPNGDLVDHLPLGEAGFFDVNVPSAGKPTLYSRVGDLPIVIMLLLAGMVFVFRRKQH